MSNPAKTITFLGLLFLLGLTTDTLARRARLPRVTLLLLFGFVMGPSVFNVMPLETRPWFALVSDMALVMIGFLLGERFTRAGLKRYGRLVLIFSVAEVAVTAMVVLAGFLVLGVPIVVALLLAGIATATDPMATLDVVRESRARGVFSRTLLGVVAIDDAWGLIIFSLLLTAAQSLSGGAGGPSPILHGLIEVGGALLLGVGLGVPMAFLTGRIKAGEPTLVEALGLVFLCGGLALWLNVSFLLAAMIMGTVVANLARHHARPFHAIEGIEWPFMILFFVLAGASLEVQSLGSLWLVGGAYVGFRLLGRFLSGVTGGIFSRQRTRFGLYMGASFLPQAGVAMGMALLASQRLPEMGEIILPVVIASTVLFEIFGPICTRVSLVRMGETPPDR